MDKVSINDLSKEFRSIFDEAFQEAKSKRLTCITEDQVFYILVRNYCNKIDTISFTGDEEGTSLMNFLTDLTPAKRNNLLEKCSKLADKSASSFPVDPDFYSSKPGIAVSESFVELLQMCREQVQRKNMVFKIQGRPIVTVEDFVLCTLIDSEHENIIAGNCEIAAAILKAGMSIKGMVNKAIGKDIKDLASKITDKDPEMKGILDKLLGTDSDEKEDDKGDSDSDEEDFFRAGEQEAINTRPTDPNSTTPMLDQFAIDMNIYAKDGKYDVVVGREKEMDQLIEILSCKKKNNAILLGDPGCGKTAIVEGLAQKLASGNVPAAIKGKKIMSLSTTDLMAGTQFRGQLEERVQKLCKELKNNPDIILYIDEFHQSTSDSSTSIADMLKPSLGRGELNMIASTTLIEYKKFIEKDGALKRRFQKVLVEEPNLEQTFEILKGLAPRYGKFHKVVYPDNVLKAVSEWSEKYVYDRKSPDRAIDIMDTAGAKTKLVNTPVETLTRFDELTQKMNECDAEKIKCINDGNFEDGQKYRDEYEKLRKERDAIVKAEEESEDTSSYTEVTLEIVASVISNLTGVPQDKICNPEIEKLKKMKTDLEAKVIGQDEAIQETSMALSKSFLGLRDESKPVACIMLLGSTGTGKTLLCEEIAKTVYGDSKAMIRIDCGEFHEPHTISKLIGAPPSYVGFNEPGIFDQIRERPNSLVLFDEVEKMSQEIRNTIFLNIMSTGMIKMSNGIEVSFRNCIIIFTGNVGTKEMELKGNGIGFGGTMDKETKKKSNTEVIMKAVKKEFRPEFIGRLSKIIVFNDLGKPEMMKIFDLELGKLQKRLKSRNYNLSVTEKMKQYIVDNVDTKYGARDLNKEITAHIEDKICETMLNTDTAGKYNIEVDLNEKNESIIVFS